MSTIDIEAFLLTGINASILTGGVQNEQCIIEQKKQVVAEIADKLKASKSTVVVDYRGLNVAEVTELRKQLREAGIEFKVYKNSMTRRAAEAAELSGLNEYINRSKRNCIQ